MGIFFLFFSFLSPNPPFFLFSRVGSRYDTLGVRSESVSERVSELTYHHHHPPSPALTPTLDKKKKMSK